MAVAGGATGAYLCWLDEDGKLRIEKTTTLRSLCDKPELAAEELRNGNMVTVASGDMEDFHRMVAVNAPKENGNE